MQNSNYEEKYMKVAFNLAKRHSGLTGSNPSVGCVVVKNGEIVSSASTEFGGRPHAENIALSKNGNFSGADLFVTLEPCNHFGKTPPCVQAILNAGVKRVFVGVRDTDKRVQGSGIDALKIENVEVFEGVMGAEISQFYKPYLSAKERKSPFVSAKIICSADGKIATKTGISKWISDAKSRTFTNFLRHKYDGILVGGETFRKDSPLLTCRTEGFEGFSPKRFVLSKSITQIEGFEVVNGDFASFLPSIYSDFGINHLLIEGGAGVVTKAILEDVVDEILIGHAPFFIGADGKNCFSLTGLENLVNSRRFKLKESFIFGDLSFNVLVK
jgi:diaminohydroxyphosphoribosylaminopyrimidine deaminase/5-amino-6-(5-phosphoribosylamino)uracil reductase